MNKADTINPNPEKHLTLMGHLAELRTRLIRCVIAVVITTVVAFIFYHQLFNILMYPAGQMKFIYIELTEMLGAVFRVCLSCGIMAAVPYITYEAIMFASPGLTAKERKYVYIVIPWIALMFAGGVVFGYFVLIPPAMKFLMNFGSDIATPQIRIGNYISIITKLLLAIGLVFELPVVTTFLARIGIVTGKWLAGKRKWAIVLAFVAAAMITPTWDPINQTLVAAPLVVLYELSIWLAYAFGKKKPASNSQ
jgi:sec-independent protein translocase protein TatC